MSKLIKKASSSIDSVPQGRFERYGLKENPFPSQAILNKDSTERKFNGSIYEPEIRSKEYNMIIENFIKIPQSNLNHQRLGFILDSSYIGRGNGKTAFLLNLTKKINEDYCLDLSNNTNKCFAIYFQPEAGGRTKTFESFVDILFNAILDSGIIKNSLAILRIEAITALNSSDDFLKSFSNDEELIHKFNDQQWFTSDERNVLFNFSKIDITREIFKNSYLQNVSSDFPLYKDVNFIFPSLVTQEDFAHYYGSIKKGQERLNFVFTELINFFLAAGFNGAYLFVDDFERIPDHQSAIQKKDFVTQLRTVLYDGLYLNSKIGFFNFIFALHAGVPRILQDAWGLSGLEQRVSLNPSFEDPKHMILFDKISDNHAVLLIEKYLSEYRTEKEVDPLHPFTKEAINAMGLKAELNAAKILQMAYNFIERAASEEIDVINDEYVNALTKHGGVETDNLSNPISNTETIDLIKKATQKE